MQRVREGEGGYGMISYWYEMLVEFDEFSCWMEKKNLENSKFLKMVYIKSTLLVPLRFCKSENVDSSFLDHRVRRILGIYTILD